MKLSSLFVILTTTFVLDMPRSFAQQDWFARNYTYDGELGVDYEKPIGQVYDHDFDYIKEGRREERVSRKPRNKGNNQMAPNAVDLRGTIDFLHGRRLLNSLGNVERGTAYADRSSVQEVVFSDGRSHLVDFGSIRQPRTELGLKPGASVIIRGRQGTINGRAIVFATDVHSNGRWYSIPTRAAGSYDSPVTLQGLVDNFQRVYWSKTSYPRPLIRIRLEDGRAVLVDLGRNATLEDLELKPDSLVTIVGWRDSLNEHSFIRGQEITVDGKSVLLR